MPDFKKILKIFVGLILVGTFVDAILELMRATSNPFFPVSVLKILSFVIPNFLDTWGFIIGIVETLIIHWLLERN